MVKYTLEIVCDIDRYLDTSPTTIMALNKYISLALGNNTKVLKATAIEGHPKPKRVRPRKPIPNKQ